MAKKVTAIQSKDKIAVSKLENILKIFLTFGRNV